MIEPQCFELRPVRGGQNLGRFVVVARPAIETQEGLLPHLGEMLLKWLIPDRVMCVLDDKG
jgi:hypothetical protein